MNDEQNQITVEDVRKLALPLGTRVISGDGLLNRLTHWTTVIYHEDTLVNKVIQEDELVIVASPTGNAPIVSSDIDIVRWAADGQASAIVFSESISPPAIAEAKAYNMPLMQLPSDSKARIVEKSIVSLLVDRKGQTERRGIQIYRQLTQISSRNEGMAELINAMARLTNKAIVIQDKRLRVSEHTLQPQLVGMWEDIEGFLRKVDNLPVELQDRHRVSDIEKPALMQSLPLPGMARLVAPVVTKGIGRGYLSIIGYDNDIDDIDLLVCEHGAAACALEMAKLKAVSETEKRLRGTFLDRLLIGDVSQQEAIRQGERFDHDMTQAHVAIVLSWRGDTPPSMRRLETMVNSVIEANRARALVWIREKEHEVVVFHASDPKDPIDTSLKLTENIRQRN
jgi:purine catabolism regulator